MGRKIIGMTGAFGSGASFISENFFKTRGFNVFSLSSILKDMYERQHGERNEERGTLQDFGNELREQCPSVLAKTLDEEEISKRADEDIIIDSIRNPSEIELFRNRYPEFILIGVFADYETRWERVKSKYKGSRDKFDIDEKRDQGITEPLFGQRISDCFFEADLIISNNEKINAVEPNDEYANMNSRISTYLAALDSPDSSTPTLKETLMAAAYTSGRRSRCVKRKVGAVITDGYDRIISSGFNGVPMKLKECISLDGHCYRDEKRSILSETLCAELGIEATEDKKKIITKNIKLLDYCRALHGEENAIINLVGRGVDLTNSVMYVTTYPCNLCANKIVQARISKVVYFEPYPVEEAKKILLSGGVDTEPFEGVTFRAFFKFYKFEP